MTKNELIKLAYKELSKKIYWREGKPYWKRNKKIAGYIDRYRMVCSYHKGHEKKISAHRLMWYMETGEIPYVIDHINGIKDDNRICNLRECTVAQNNYNRRKIKGSSKFKGVSWSSQRGKWMASIKKSLKSKYIGYYDCEHCAAIAYDYTAIELFGEFAYLNFK